MKNTILFSAILCLFISGIVSAVDIDWVTVGNSGNANDPATGDLYGSVGYEYKIVSMR